MHQYYGNPVQQSAETRTFVGSNIKDRVCIRQVLCIAKPRDGCPGHGVFRRTCPSEDTKLFTLSGLGFCFLGQSFRSLLLILAPKKLRLSPTLKKTLHARVVAGCIDNVIRQVDQQLREASFGGSVIAQNGRKCGIAQRLGQALAKGFSCSGIITESQKAAYDVFE